MRKTNLYASELDPWVLFLNSMRAPMTRDRYQTRVAKFFDTAEMDATFYEKFYKYVTKDTFTAMTKATPNNFQFSVKVPETVTHDERLDTNKGATTQLQES